MAMGKYFHLWSANNSKTNSPICPIIEKVNRKVQTEPQAEVAANPWYQEKEKKRKKWHINVCIANKQMYDKHKDQLPLPQARWSKC